jgi:oligopeptide transport system substrate-binding protein
MFETGKLDFLSTIVNPLSTVDLAQAKTQGSLRSVPVGGLRFCTFNTTQFPLNNKHIRKALGLAIDRTTIADHLCYLGEGVATRILSPVLVGFVEKQLYPSNTTSVAKKAWEEGLKELGVDAKTVTKALTLSYESTETNHQIAQAIQQQWKQALGIEVPLQDYETKTVMQKHMSRDYSVGIDYCIAQYHDGNNILERFLHRNVKKNLPGFEHPEYIRLLDLAQNATDAGTRLKFMELAEELLADEMAIMPLYHIQFGALVKPEFKNVQFSPLGNLLFKKVMKQCF